MLNCDSDLDTTAPFANDENSLASIAAITRLTDSAAAAIIEFNRHSNRWRQSHRLAGTSLASIKQPAATLTFTPTQVIQHLTPLRQLSPEISIDFMQNVKNHSEPGLTVLVMTINRVCRVMIALHGLLPEWLVVRGLAETYCDSRGKPDLFTASQSKTFQAVKFFGSTIW